MNQITVNRFYNAGYRVSQITKSILSAVAVSTVFAVAASACAPPPKSNAVLPVGSAQIQAMLAKAHAGDASSHPNLIGIPQGEPSVAGMWITTLIADGQVVGIGLEQFSSDGLENLNDTSPILEGNICFGTWVKTAPFTYAVNHPTFLYDDPGVNVVGVGYIKETITVDKTGKTYTGTSSFVAYDLAGNIIVPASTYDLTGARVGINTVLPPMALAPRSGKAGNRLSAWMRTPAAEGSN